jgi:Ser/Thr protein kinase RdoA (MazF antagonist)
VRTAVLTYKPARRVVVRLDGTGGPVGVARVQPAGRTLPTADAARCWARVGLEVAAVHRPRRGGRVTLVDFLEGARPADGTEPGLLAEVGSLLARAHRAPPFRDAPSADHVASARTAVRSVTAIAPHLGATATAVAARVAAQLDPGAPGVLVHGDLSADQVLVRGPGLALLDLDRVRVDLPAADAASWFAAEVLAGRWAPDADPVDALEPMIRAYAGGRAGRLTDHLRPLAALALLQRAAEPFRCRHADGRWAARVAALVEGAAVQAGRS